MNDTRPNYTPSLIKRLFEEINKPSGHLSLSELSERLNISNEDFKKLFSKWVGIPSKHSYQYLQLEYTVQLLKNHRFVWEAANKLGLPDPVSLNGIIVTWEVSNPKEFGKRKKKFLIDYSWIDSPFGEALVMATKRGICGMAFSSELGKSNALYDMMQRWPEAQFNKNTEAAFKAGVQFTKSISTTKIHVIGAPLQVKVWQALMRIPSGQVTTYSDIATAIGKPKATRAVGTAIGKNPLSWLIPCHRVLRKSGELGGYHWGGTIKHIMLAYESAHRDAKP